jgi:hypothetical protein
VRVKSSQPTTTVPATSSLTEWNNLSAVESDWALSFMPLSAVSALQDTADGCTEQLNKTERSLTNLRIYILQVK